MSIWSRISNILTGGAKSENRMLTIYVLSHRCKEPIAGQVDLFNELSRTEDDGDSDFYTRKVLHTSGESRCFDQVEVQLWFNRSKQLKDYAVEGGRWLNANEYQAELARFNAPAEPTEEPAETKPSKSQESAEE